MYGGGVFVRKKGSLGKATEATTVLPKEPYLHVQKAPLAKLPRASTVLPREPLWTWKYGSLDRTAEGLNTHLLVTF